MTTRWSPYLLSLIGAVFAALVLAMRQRVEEIEQDLGSLIRLAAKYDHSVSLIAAINNLGVC